MLSVIVLDYYKNDYKPIEQSVTATKCLDALSQRVGDVSDLYNGNIPGCTPRYGTWATVALITGTTS